MPWPCGRIGHQELTIRAETNEEKLGRCFGEEAESTPIRPGAKTTIVAQELVQDRAIEGSSKMLIGRKGE